MSGELGDASCVEELPGESAVECVMIGSGSRRWTSAMGGDSAGSGLGLQPNELSSVRHPPILHVERGKCLVKCEVTAVSLARWVVISQTARLPAKMTSLAEAYASGAWAGECDRGR